MAIMWDVYARSMDPIAKGIGAAVGDYVERQQAQELLARALGNQPQPSTLAAFQQPAPQPVAEQPRQTSSLQPEGNIPASLIRTESGGNWQAQNNVRGAGGLTGHFGRLQFGQARLQDAKNAGVIPQDMTPQQFMASPEAQRAAERWHFADIDRNIANGPAASAIGRTINGVPVTRDGLLAVAHLGGVNGMNRFVETNGQYNPSDANGTSLLSYLQQHQSRQQGNPLANVAPMQGGQAQSMQQPTQTLAQLSAPAQPRVDLDTLSKLMTNRYGAPVAQAIIAKQLGRDPVEQQMNLIKLRQAEQQLQGGSPMQQQLAQAQLEAANLANQRSRAEMSGEGAKLTPQDVGDAIVFVNQKGEEVRRIQKSPQFMAVGEDQRLINKSTGQAVGGDGTQPKPKLTEGQSKDLNYYQRGVGAENTLQGIEDTLTSSTQGALSSVPGVGNMLTNEKFQSAQQAGREVLASILRKDTGAAITKEEMDVYGKMYLPQPGDNKNIIDQKRVARQRALDAIRQGMGKAEVLATSRISPKQSTAPSKSQGAGDPLASARDAISRGAPRDAVIQRLRQAGIDPSGL